MRPLSQLGAQHFVSSFGASSNVSGVNVEDYLAKLPTKAKIFAEGTPLFSELQDCILRESERSLLMSSSCYARALDGLRESSAYWSLVGLYYASFFSVKAALGMHGCWMKASNRWIEVIDANPGNQKLEYKTSVYHCSGGEKGSHKVTWVAFYEAMNKLSAWLTSPHAKLAINPVNASKTWMINTRNEVNYDPLAAFEMMGAFQSTFDPENIPKCFGGKLQTMFQITQAFVLFSKELAINYGLKTDVWSVAQTRKDWAQQYITSAQHSALTQFSKSEYPSLEY